MEFLEDLNILNKIDYKQGARLVQYLQFYAQRGIFYK